MNFISVAKNSSVFEEKNLDNFHVLSFLLIDVMASNN